MSRLQKLLSCRFGRGDLRVLAAAFSFAVYNTMAKKKPAAISPVNFLFIIFSFGTLLVFPVFLWEMQHTATVQWDKTLICSVLYLGIGASVICFLLWNIAIRILGAGRTALFGNLIPVFSSMEAVLLLNEKITSIHLISFILVVAGLVIANLKK